MKPPHPARLLLALLLALPAGVRAEVAPRETVITADYNETWTTETETRSLFKGSVTLLGTNLKITCDQLEVVAPPAGDQTTALSKLDQIRSLVAQGRVHIVQGMREVTCGRADVLPPENKVVLTGNPVVIDGATNTVATGEEITLLRGERRLIGKKIKIVGPQIRDLGVDVDPSKLPGAPKADVSQPGAPTPDAPKQP